MKFNVINIILFALLLCFKDSICYTLNGWQCYDANGYTPYKCAIANCTAVPNADTGQTNCNAVNGTLLEIYNTDDDNLAKEAIIASSCSYFWFGGRGNGTNFLYATTNCTIDQLYPAHWFTGYPTSTASTECTTIFLYNGQTSWFNYPCETSNGSVKNGFVCQKLYSTEPECPLATTTSNTPTPTTPTPTTITPTTPTPTTPSPTTPTLTTPTPTTPNPTPTTYCYSNDWSCQDNGCNRRGGYCITVPLWRIFGRPVCRCVQRGQWNILWFLFSDF